MYGSNQGDQEKTLAPSTTDAVDTTVENATNENGVIEVSKTWLTEAYENLSLKNLDQIQAHIESNYSVKIPTTQLSAFYKDMNLSLRKRSRKNIFKLVD